MLIRRHTEVSGAVAISELESDLVADLEAKDAATARRRCAAVTLHVAAGEWAPAHELLPPPSGLGLPIVEGVLERDSSIAGIGCSDLLGPGDLLPRRLRSIASRTAPSASAVTAAARAVASAPVRR